MQASVRLGGSAVRWVCKEVVKNQSRKICKPRSYSILTSVSLNTNTSSFLSRQRLLDQPAQRTFSNSLPLSKKRPRDEREPKEGAKSTTKNEVTDPFNMSSLDASISETTTKLKDDLTSLRTGGRLSPTAIEAMRVTIKGQSGSPDSAANLGDIAQVIKRGGRMLVIQVLDPDHVKPVNAALLAANLNLTPTPDPHNPAQLNLPLPPPTREHRLEAAKDVQKLGEHAVGRIRNARAGTHKKLQAMLKGRAVGPDDFKKAEKLMEKVVKGGLDEVKKLADGTKGAILEGCVLADGKYL